MFNNAKLDTEMYTVGDSCCLENIILKTFYTTNNILIEIFDCQGYWTEYLKHTDKS